MSTTALRTISLSRCVLAAALVALAACGAPPGELPPEEAKAEIQAMLEEYLPKVGQAYRESDSSVLEEYVVPKERARTEKRLAELEAQGVVYDPELVSVTVEDVSIWNYSNAFASTLEVWNVRSTTLSGDQVLQEKPGQRNKVKYQLKQEEGRWKVLYRELSEVLE